MFSTVVTADGYHPQLREGNVPQQDIASMMHSEFPMLISPSESAFLVPLYKYVQCVLAQFLVTFMNGMKARRGWSDTISKVRSPRSHVTPLYADTG